MLLNGGRLDALIGSVLGAKALRAHVAGHPRGSQIDNASSPLAFKSIKQTAEINDRSCN